MLCTYGVLPALACHTAATTGLKISMNMLTKQPTWRINHNTGEGNKRGVRKENYIKMMKYRVATHLGKSGNFTLVKEIRKSPGNCGLPVVCNHSCDSHKINNLSTVK